MRREIAAALPRTVLLLAVLFASAGSARADSCDPCWRRLCHEWLPIRGAIVATLSEFDASKLPPQATLVVDEVSGNLPHRIGDVISSEALPHDARAGDRFVWGTGGTESGPFHLTAPYRVSADSFTCEGRRTASPLAEGLAFAASANCSDLAEQAWGPAECGGGCDATSGAGGTSVALPGAVVLALLAARSRWTSSA
jgi:hypothetical protein